MPTSPLLSDPAHWRKRAEELRALANTMHVSESRAMLLQIAEDYDRLAERAEQRAKQQEADHAAQARR